MRAFLEFIFIAFGFIFFVQYLNKSEWARKQKNENLVWIITIALFIIFGWLLTGEGSFYNP